MKIKTKIVFIINPISGIGKQKGIDSSIDDNIDKSIFEYSIIYTTVDCHSDCIVKKEFNNYDVFVAVGGDGTVNETAKHIINTNKILAIIPAGSGNGYARHFEIPLNLKNAIECINNYNITKVDTATINNLPFLGFGGVGFDAHIAQLFSKTKKRGLWNYIKLIVNSYKNYKEQEFKIIIDNKQYKTKAFLIVFANTSQFGNDAKIAPLAIAYDNLFEISIVKKPSVFSSLKFVVDLFTGNLHKNKHVTSLKGKHISINQLIDYINLDGESVELNEAIDITLNHLSLNLIVPKNG